MPFDPLIQEWFAETFAAVTEPRYTPDDLRACAARLAVAA